ncbi:hypothetical protein PCASD_05389 [Puccinia coronata f. sp. avenae]|uniref:Uncharacterized protein n=1 Tax=Puccinia coronata f. sp. avenae TaxID=200324 RepID=A0A2N5UV66_9BASI|nr:hypothetical protein PCASD_05389 [Puccinia coronata f. sp. avenae]
MSCPHSLWVLYVLASVLHLLPDAVGAEQPTSPVRNHMLEKRGMCFVPNSMKGCTIWKAKSCCTDCCTRYYMGRVPAFWGTVCGCPPRHPPPPPVHVVVVQPPAPAPPPPPPTHTTIVVTHAPPVAPGAPPPPVTVYPPPGTYAY